MTLIGHMVVRNEMDRYLPHTLEWLAALTDRRVLVYDDRSTDGTARYVSLNCRIPLAQRPDHVPSFAEDESAFREAAWRTLERAFDPTPDDWVLVMDADEFLVSTDPDGDLDTVRRLIDDATNETTAVTFPVAEVFGFDDANRPLVRTDGYWSDITACRLVRWRPGGTFDRRREGGGSVPSAWPKPDKPSTDLTILHYGYATAKDRATKFERYHGGTGHNPLHVRSIRQKPRVQPWTGMAPPFAGHR